MPDPGTDAHQKLLITLLRAAEDVQSNLGGKTLWSHGFKDQTRKDIYHKCIKGQFAAYFKRSDGAVYSLDQVKKFFDSTLDEWEQRAGTRNQTGDADEAESEMDRRLRVLCEARKAAANSNSDSAQYKKSKAEYAEAILSVQEFELQNKEARSKKKSRIHHDKRELNELIAHYHENSDDCAKSLEAANDGKAPTREEIIDCMHRDDAKARALLKNHFSAPCRRARAPPGRRAQRASLRLARERALGPRSGAGLCEQAAPAAAHELSRVDFVQAHDGAVVGARVGRGPGGELHVR